MFQLNCFKPGNVLDHTKGYTFTVECLKLNGKMNITKKVNQIEPPYHSPSCVTSTVVVVVIRTKWVSCCAPSRCTFPMVGTGVGPTPGEKAHAYALNFNNLIATNIYEGTALLWDVAFAGQHAAPG